MENSFYENIPDIEEELPFLPESMKKEKGSEGKQKNRLSSKQGEVNLFRTPSDPSVQAAEEKKLIDRPWSYRQTDADQSVEAAEEDAPSVDPEQKYIILVIYDIISNKQRVKMAKLLSGYGSRVQKSAFEARLNKKQYARLLKDIKKMLKADDNVRIYKLTGYEEILTFGDREYEIIEDVIVI